MTFSLSRQRRSSLEVYEVGRLSRSWVSPPGFGGRGLVRAAVINNAAINPGLSPAGMTAFGKKRRESSSPPYLYPSASFLRYPFRSSLSLSLSLSLSISTRTSKIMMLAAQYASAEATRSNCLLLAV